MDIVPIKDGTTDALVQAVFSGPPTTHTRPYRSSVQARAATTWVSPGHSLQLSYNLPRGTYLLVCFVSDDKTGLPHAIMRMHKVIHLTEQQARQSLVPSKTTLMGLVKHATFVEKVWFDEAVTCRSRDELGIPAGPNESFDLYGDETIASVRQAHREACAASRRAVADMDLSALLQGNRRGPLPLRWSTCTYYACSRSIAATRTFCANSSCGVHSAPERFSRAATVQARVAVVVAPVQRWVNVSHVDTREAQADSQDVVAAAHSAHLGAADAVRCHSHVREWAAAARCHRRNRRIAHRVRRRSASGPDQRLSAAY